MLFNSIDFALFLPIVFLFYWLAGTHSLRLQNIVIVLASYFFYGWWDWRFLSLILLSSLVDFWVGIQISKSNQDLLRKRYLVLSLVMNLGALGLFKYYDFFSQSLVDTFTFFGTKLSLSSLEIILPVGISFYTFQTLSYSIDVYRRKLEPTKDIISFMAFVSFFPQLVAGPIERAVNLLPQFYSKRSFDYLTAADGLRQMLWGFFKKIVIADNCAFYANMIFNNSEEYNGSTLIVGALLFAFQIYGDFSGYSDIATGIAKLFGFRLSVNFSYPYFSRDVAEFWRRWHISLSTWFRDYLYVPLGGSKYGQWMTIRNVVIVFLVSGLWHGANWTFVIWGALNAVFIIPLLLFNQNRIHLETVAKGKLLPSVKDTMKILFTFLLISLSWIFFRSDNLSHAIAYCSVIFSSSSLSVPEVLPKNLIGLTAFFILIEWIGREDKYAIEKIGISWNRIPRWSFYYVLVMIIFLFGGKEQAFIYFQF